MKYFKKIESERLYLSPTSVEDAETYVKWLNDFAVSDGIMHSVKVTTLQEETEWLKNNSGYNFAIIKKEDNQLIGSCGFNQINHIHQTATIGIFIGEEINRNQGYGQEIITALLSYGFNYLNFHNVMLCTFSFNKNAISCYKKIGFKEFGKRKECYYLSGKMHDEIYMEILKEDFMKEGKQNV